MSFLLKPVPDITVPVTIHIPGEDEPCTVQARWKLHEVDAAKAKTEAINKGEVTDEQLAADDLLDIEGMTDEKGEPMALTGELREALLQRPYIRRPLLMSWFEAQSGRVRAAAKN